MRLLEQHEENMATAGFRWSTRWTFPVVYGWSARRFFKKVLRDTKDLGEFALPPLQLGGIRLEETPRV
jgi:hypothetical protein